MQIWLLLNHFLFLSSFLVLLLNMKQQEMAENSISSAAFARFFCRHDLKRRSCEVLLVSFLVVFVFFVVFRPSFRPLEFVNARLSMDSDHKMSKKITESPASKRIPSNKTIETTPTVRNDTSKSSNQVVSESASSNRLQSNKTIETTPTMKNHTSKSSNQRTSDAKIEPEKASICTTEPRTIYCNIKGDVRVNGKSGMVFFSTRDGNPAELPSGNSTWRIKPYARREHETALNRVREWTLQMELTRNALPRCTKNHSAPAVLFSLGGVVGNHFHDFSDYVIPLYLTSRRYNGEVQFLVTNKISGWIDKFDELIKNLSHYNVIYIDEEEEDVHCFPYVIVGLERHSAIYTELTIDPSNSSYSMSDFRQFIRESYSLKKPISVKLTENPKNKPRILIVSRKKTRAFVNANEITEMAERLGFEVVTTEANMNLSSFSQLVNSCDVMMGVHGAGLTNMVFLPENAVLVQIVPIGGLEWYSKTYFGDPAKEMKLRYLEYKIKPEESTLMQRYPADHEILRYPLAIWKQGYMPWKAVYLVQQNVVLDVYRFKSVLLQALELLHQ